MGRELERKFRGTPAVLEAIRQRFGDFTPIAMETVYYDTPSDSLSRRHWTLRRRYENSAAVCTLKTPLPDGSRGEWEVCCGSIWEAVPKLCQLGAPEELPEYADQGLMEACGARFTRLAKTLELPDCVVEIALDSGVLLGGGREQPLCEVEVELKSGPDQAALRFAQWLAEEYRLEPEPKSKVARARALKNKDS